MSEIRIEAGYQAGLIGRVTEMHMAYYAKTSGFGQRFESVVAGGLASFCDRLHNSKNEIWRAVQNHLTMGAIAIDGEDLSDDTAHLRWFIMDEGYRGQGIGRQLIEKAIQFVDQQNFKETHLWTFKGLSAARHLYEAHGFKLIDERMGNQWGQELVEQRFCRLSKVNH